MADKFKKIELYGFKSFADKHEIPFSDGITVIVGPNGCGKSNVSDSVKWVFGEQSAKQMRGNSMQDVIFSGTAKRRSMSYCEVDLTFDNKDRQLFASLPYDDVVISRKLYRSGESEYLVNKVPTRLKDIVEMLRDANMAREGYSIIGQGRVASLISAKPEDRRAIFEEAAGIAKYKKRKQEVENKLIRTRENLQRINDILSEKKKQLDPLLKQAENAKKWLELHDKLKILEINTYVYRYENAASAKEIINTRLGGINEEIALTQQRYDESIKAYDEAMAKMNTVDEQINALRDEQLELTVDIEKQNGDKNVLRERLSNLTQELNRLEKENTALIASSDNAKVLLFAGKAELERKQAEFERAQEERDRLRALYEEVENEINAKERAARESKEALISAIERLTEIKSNITALKTEKASLEVVVADIKARFDNCAKSLEKSEAELADVSAKAKEFKEETESRNVQLTELKETSKSLETEINDVKTRYDDAVIKHKEALSRERLLKEMQEEYDGYNNSIKYLMSDAKSDLMLSSKIDGVVAQLIGVDEIYETAIEVALGGAAQNVVTKDEDDARYLIKYLKDKSYGRVTFLPLTSFKPRNLNSYRHLLNDAGCYGVASDLVKYDRKYENIVSGLLGSTVITDNIDTAKKLAVKSGYGFRIVTLEGDVISTQGSYTGGSRKGGMGNLFSHDRELYQTRELIASLSETIKELGETKAKLAMKKGGVDAKIDTISYDMHAGDIYLAKAEEAVSKLAEVVDAKRREKVDLELELEQKGGRLNQISDDIQSVGQLEITIAEARKNAEQAEKENSECHDELKEKRDGFYKDYNDARVTCAGIENAINSVKADITRLEDNVNSSARQIETNTIKISQDKEAIDDINERLAYVGKVDQTVALARIEEIKKQLSYFDVYKSDLGVQVNKANENRTTLTTAIQDLSNKKSQEEYMLVRVDADIEQMQQKILEDYHLEYADCLPFRIENYNVEEGMAESATLKSQMGRLGNVNVDAIEQSKEVLAEYEDLNTQRDDLDKAAKDSEIIIKSMSEEMLATFTEEFEKIRVNFIKIFKELFNGGEADLQILDDCDDPLQAGIEILASPPDKKIKAKSIQILSGGEQALTAIAILFSILRLRPMPFCILDEIDSALDDANSARFAKYLKRFSKETQFIVITHRKPTMELADNLYGVTMEEPGVSKIVSVRLSEATALAEDDKKSAISG